MIYALVLFVLQSALLIGEEMESFATPTTVREEIPCPCTFIEAREHSSFFLYGEWLYWIPFMQDPTNWEQKIANFDVLDTGTFGYIERDHASHKASLTYDFSSGYRIGAGVRLGKQMMGERSPPFQLESTFTSFNASQSSKNKNLGTFSISGAGTTTTVANTLLPLVPSTGDVTAIFGKANIGLDFDRLDINFAWPIWLTQNTILRLKTGPMFAWVKSNWKNYWSGPGFVQQTNLKWKWKGGGLAGGGDIYVPLFSGLSFVANVDIGLLFGPLKEKEQYHYDNFDVNVTVIPNTDIQATYRSSTLEPEATLGLGFDFYKKYSPIALHVTAGWELNWWFWLNQFDRNNSSTISNGSDIPSVPYFFDLSPSGLGLQGLRVQMGLEY